MGMQHKSPISQSLQERLKRCCIALCVTVEFNIYVLVTTLLGNNIKVLHNKSFLVCANICTMKVLGKETEIFLVEEDTSIFRFTIQYLRRFGYLFYLINGNFLR